MISHSHTVGHARLDRQAQHTNSTMTHTPCNHTLTPAILHVEVIAALVHVAAAELSQLVKIDLAPVHQL